jgi:hypothetical protein
VVSGEQVLVCPECQTPGWDDGADRCARCGSVRLAKSLGVVQCKQCGAEQSSEAPTTPRPAPDGGSLSDEVAAAVTRLLKPDT